MSEEIFDLFAPSEPESTTLPATSGKVLHFPSRQDDLSSNPVSQDEACCGCYFMYWGKGLLRICRNAKHPGIIGEKAFCLDATGNPESYAPFDGNAKGRLSLQEIAQNNLT